MTTSSWNNDLARAYDEKYTILEEARLEYDREVRELLKTVASAVQVEPLDPAIEQIARLPQLTEEEGGSSGRCTLEYAVPVGGKADGLLVSAWFSSPWQGVPGYLYVALLAPDTKPWHVAELRAFGQCQGWAQDRTNVLSDGPMSDPEGIYAEKLKLDLHDLVPEAAKTLRRFLLCAREAATCLHTEHDLALRMDELLVLTKQWLSGFHALKKYPTKDLTIGDWEGQRYVQLSPGNGQPGFWIGYHAERGTLMFGYNKKRGTDFEVRMREALRERGWCSLFELYKEHPGGTLFERQALRAASKNDVLQTMRSTFETFVGVLSEEE